MSYVSMSGLALEISMIFSAKLKAKVHDNEKPTSLSGVVGNMEAGFPGFG